MTASGPLSAAGAIRSAIAPYALARLALTWIQRTLLRPQVIFLLIVQISLPAPSLASSVCMKIADFDKADAETSARITSHALANLKGAPAEIRKIGIGGFHILRSDKCQHSFCHYHLVQVLENSIADVLSFVGTGWLRLTIGQSNLYDPFFDNYISAFNFEGPEGSRLLISFPRQGSMVVVSGSSRQRGGLPDCP